MLSRFWYFFLAALAGAGIAAAYIAQDRINRTSSSEASELLRRDRAEIELWLRHDARVRLDAIAPIAVHRDVRETLRQASDSPTGAPDAAKRTLATRLRELNGQLNEPGLTLLFAVDARGDIVAQPEGMGALPPGGLGAFPLVERALRGFVGDDVWVWGGNVYRMAARPVVDGGRYVGAVLHGTEVGAQLAGQLATRIPGGTLMFFYGERTLGAVVPSQPDAIQEATLKTALTEVLADTTAQEALTAGRSTDAKDLQGGLVIASRIRGAASHAGVGYAIARAVPVMASHADIFKSDQAIQAIPWVVVVPVALVLALLGILFTFLERDRPLKAFRAAAGNLASGQVQRFDEAAMKGPYRLIASDINGALDKATASASPRPVAQNLDEILGGVQQNAPSYFGFATQEPTHVPSKPIAPLAAPPAAPFSPPLAPNPGFAPALTPASGSRSLDAPPPPPPGVPRRPAPPPAAPAPISQQNAAAAFLDNDDDDEGATMVAQVPSELIAATSQLAAEDEAHHRDVFDQFVRLKERCGEPVAGLTYDRFKQTLEKNRASIMSQHQVRTVRFTVYEKGGKAALKATPVP